MTERSRRVKHALVCYVRLRHGPLVVSEVAGRLI
ncbi:unnamed protein product [Ectocarpus sp. CCAP 1310/34]|nr:unnamed protein product [Ectocarpus sp. CCAP 1310/34]